MTMFEADIIFDDAPKESGYIVANDLLGEVKAKSLVEAALKGIHPNRRFDIEIEFNADDNRYVWSAQADNRLHVTGEAKGPPPSGLVGG